MMQRLAQRLRHELYPFQMYRSAASLLAYEWNRVARLTGTSKGSIPQKVVVRKLREPVWVRFGTGDALVLAEMFGSEDYAKAIETLGPAPRILDLGANVGLSIRLWLEHRPQAKIIGVEPDPANFAIAQKNIDEANAAGRVTLVHGFASASNGAAFLNSDVSGCGIQRADKPGFAGASEIPCHSMDDLVSRFGTESIDLMKCDIEGGEKELFDSCGSWIGRVKTLVIETHQPYTMADCRADIARNGGKMKQIYLLDRQAYEVAVLIRDAGN